MRCISLWNPWALAWLLDNPRLKKFETRDWSTDYRGPLLIHAAKKRDGDVRAALNDPEMLDDLGVRAMYPADLAFGAVIGKLDITDCIPMSKMCWPGETEQRWGLWTPERFAWKRGPRPVIFKRPIPFSGSQKFFDVPLRLVQDQLEEVPRL